MRLWVPILWEIQVIAKKGFNLQGGWFHWDFGLFLGTGYNGSQWEGLRNICGGFRRVLNGLTPRGISPRESFRRVFCPKGVRRFEGDPVDCGPPHLGGSIAHGSLKWPFWGHLTHFFSTL